ncbi:MAG: hypothetical protein GY869_21755 [Planctomycetes bacterium]|nr:hypothetical protein [Planctomycetota bacterium]
MPQNQKKSQRPKWIILLIIIALLLLGFIAHKGLKKQQIQNKLQSYRDQGLPATAAELETWHKYPPENQNAALKVIQAASLFIDWEEKPLPKDRSIDRMFPRLYPQMIFRSNNPPADWDQKNAYFLPIVGETIPPLPGESLDQSSLKYITEFLDDNASALKSLHQALQLNQSRLPIDYSPGIYAKLNILSFIHCSKRLQLLTLLHLENQQPEQAVVSIIDSFKLPLVLLQEPMLSPYLGGTSCTTSALSNLEYTLNRYALNHKLLNDISVAISKLQSAPGLSFALIGDRCGFSDALYQYDMEPLYMFQPELKKYGPLIKFSGLVEIDHLYILDILDQVRSVLDLPFHQRLQASNNIDKQISNVSKLHIVLHTAMPFGNSYTSGIEIDLRFHAKLHIAQTALAIEHYRLDNNNQLPDTLTDLIPDDLDTIPLDPFDGLSIKYKKTNPGYVVYSIGPNLTDDIDITLNTTTGDLPDITFTVKRK